MRSWAPLLSSAGIATNLSLEGVLPWFGCSRSVEWHALPMTITPGDLDHPQVRALLEQHVKDARAQSAPGSSHALDLEGLRAPEITFWSAWEEDALLGTGALKRLSTDGGEIKSMHTVLAWRRRGVGSAMLRHIIAAARGPGHVSAEPRNGLLGLLRTCSRAVQTVWVRRVPSVRRLCRRPKQRVHVPRSALRRGATADWRPLLAVAARFASAAMMA